MHYEQNELFESVKESCYTISQTSIPVLLNKIISTEDDHDKSKFFSKSNTHQSNAGCVIKDYFIDCQPI